MKVSLKIVPDDLPNDDGRWIDVNIDEFPHSSGLSVIWPVLELHSPKGFHVVAYAMAKVGTSI